MQDRDSRQCKERWTHFLAPEIVKSEWTKEEDLLLEMKVIEHGNKWKTFENYFPGRSGTNIKNRYRLILRHKHQEMIIKRTSGKGGKQAVLPKKEEEFVWKEPLFDEKLPNCNSDDFDDMW
jgi:hypothetical protein